jgi:hypothetical protein
VAVELAQALEAALALATVSLLALLALPQAGSAAQWTILGSARPASTRPRGQAQGCSDWLGRFTTSRRSREGCPGWHRSMKSASAARRRRGASAREADAEIS